MLREYSWGYSSNCDEDILGVQKASLNMFWEYSAYLTNFASDWLRAESSPVDEEERKRKKEKRKKRKKVDGIATHFTRFGGNLFIC